MRLFPTTFSFVVAMMLVSAIWSDYADAATSTYDTLGRIKHVEYADGSIIDWIYDTNGNILDRIVNRPIELTLTVDPPGAGTVTGAGRFRRNTSTALTATAGSAFVFAAWKRQDGTVLSTIPTYTHTVTTAETLVAHFSPPAPEIVIEDPSTTPAIDLVDGVSNIAFAVPALAYKTLTIRNTGSAPLTNLATSFTGVAAGDFTVSSLQSTIAPAGSATIQLQFRPRGLGIRSATLHIASNDTDESPFDITLTVPGVRADLSALSTSHGSISPAFNTAQTSYDLTLPTTQGYVSVTATAIDSGSTLTVNGIVSQSGKPSVSVPLSGTSNVITVLVTGYQGVITQSYVINVSRVPSSSGELDTTFGNGGKVRLDFGSSNDLAYAMALAPDGGCVLVGRTKDNNQSDFALVKVTASGSPDPTFGIGGLIQTMVGPQQNQEEVAHSIVFQPDGKFLVGGFVDLLGNKDLAVMRWSANNMVDGIFGGGARQIMPAGSLDDDVRGIVVQPDGKIMIVGYGYQSYANNDIVVVRLNTDGWTDNSFGTNGKVVIDYTGSYDNAYACALQADGKILVAGSRYVGGKDVLYVLRLTTAGVPDSTFGVSGAVTTPLTSEATATSLVVQSDGKIVVGGHTGSSGSNNFVLARYNQGGSLDSSFGFDGIVTTDFGFGDDAIQGLVLLPDGRFIAGGWMTSASGDHDMAAACYTATGDLDASFGTGGKAVVSFGNGDDRAMGITRNSDGSIMLGGYSHNGSNYDFALAKLASVSSAPAIPEIEVEAPLGTPVATGVELRYPALPVASTSELTVKIANLGTQALTGVSVSFTGTNASDFTSPNQLSTSVVAGGNTSFVVRFTPSAPGVRSALMRIASNDADESIYEIMLQGEGLNATQSWRQQYFQITSNSGDAADDATPMQDGIPNLMKFATGLDPTKSGKQPGELSRVADGITFTYTRSKAAVADAVQFTVEWSDDLSGSSWSTAGVSEAITDEVTRERVTVTIPVGNSQRRFVRLKVSR